MTINYIFMLWFKARKNINDSGCSSILHNPTCTIFLWNKSILHPFFGMKVLLLIKTGWQCRQLLPNNMIITGYHSGYWNQLGQIYTSENMCHACQPRWHLSNMNLVINLFSPGTCIKIVRNFKIQYGNCVSLLWYNVFNVTKTIIDKFPAITIALYPKTCSGLAMYSMFGYVHINPRFYLLLLWLISSVSLYQLWISQLCIFPTCRLYQNYLCARKGDFRTIWS